MVKEEGGKKDHEKKRKRDSDEKSKKVKKEKKEKKHESDRKKTDDIKRLDNDGKEKQPKTVDSNDSSALWLQKHEIQITDDFSKTQWMPIMSFSDIKVSDPILHPTKKFSAPTPIQSVCWPILLEGRDIIGIAETGSGKTFGFGLPAMVHLQSILDKINGKEKKKPRVLIMTPTRELAIQINEQIVLFSEKLSVKSLCVFGGISKHDQISALKQGVDVLIACPGRLGDLMSDGSCSLKDVSYVVLDEADRLLDSGFEKEVRDILSATNSNRQIALFSATWPKSVEKLAAEFLRKPVKVTVGSPDLGANANIKQIVEVIEEREKERKLLGLLSQYHQSRKNRVIVFALYKKEAARVERFLQNNGWPCIAIHGDMSQKERSENFQKFRSGQVPLLIATDVAARGLDIPKVEYVINFTFPLTIEDYVHRIGRTGRAGATGIAHTFFTSGEKPKSGELINILKQTNQEVPQSLLAFGTTVKKKEHAAYGAFFKEIDPSAKATKITFDSDNDE